MSSLGFGEQNESLAMRNPGEVRLTASISLTLPAPIPLPLPPSATQPAPGPATLPPPPSATSTPGPRPAEHARSNGEQKTPLESPALQDISSRANVTSSTQEGYIVPGDVVSIATFGCKSRRNLAACLAAKVFTPQERQLGRAGLELSQGAGKNALECLPCKGHLLCLHAAFPLQRLEMQLLADKEMR